MKQKSPTISIKEAFFRDDLVPTGQLAEVYLSQVKRHCRWHHEKLSQLLFDNLGLVSTYAISPATAATKRAFSPLTKQLQSLQKLLKEDLLPLRVSKPDHKVLGAFRSAAGTLMASRMQPTLAALHKSMKFSDDKRGEWLEPLVQQPTPLTQKGRYSKWRTLVRNMDFQVNMAAHGLSVLAADISLGSEQGRAELPELWRTLFNVGAGATTAEELPSIASSHLPAGITVQSNTVGALAVTCRFDPKRALKKLLADVESTGIPLPEDITLRLAPVELTTLCGYRELPETVDEAVQWKANMVQQADETRQMICTVQTTGKLAKARAKLQQSLSTDELQLLAESGELKLDTELPSKPRSPKAGARRKKVAVPA